MQTKVTQTKAANAKATPAATAPVAQSGINPAILQARANVAAKAKSGIGVTLHTSGKPITGLNSQPLIGKPTQKMCQYISAIKGHPGIGQCVKRWHLYSVGQTLLHCRITNGLTVNDVNYWAGLGYLTLSPATPAQYAAIVAAWQAGAFSKPGATALISQFGNAPASNAPAAKVA